MSHADDEDKPSTPLRRGWTTGACATAATRAAYELLIVGECPATVSIALPGGGPRPVFAIANSRRHDGSATAGVVKDAGDDPDVTHGALVLATVERGAPGSGVTFRAGPGVGMVTRPGLPIPPGDPAINPVPREMMRAAITEAAAALAGPADVSVTVAIPGGDVLARRTLNGRLGIVGGLSILGTTGIVIPYSCAAWIDSIHRGVDVARASGLTHIAASTGSVSEAAVQRLHGLADTALIEMGNFAGGFLKYVRRHPLPRVTIAGGAAKITKLAQGLMDLHSKRGAVDRDFLLDLAAKVPGGRDVAGEIAAALTTDAALQIALTAGIPLPDHIAAAARQIAVDTVADPAIAIDVVIVGRDGRILGRAPF